MRVHWLTLVAVFSDAALAQRNLAVSELTLKADPEPRVRPFESIVIQARAYGQTAAAEGQASQRVRLQRNGVKLRTSGDNSGWVSKPFRYQGKDDESFYSEGSGRFANILSMVTKDFVLQDSALYTAPEKPGTYLIEAELEGKSASISITVESNAPSRKTSESRTFPAEAAKADPYRRIVEHWSPFLAQETWFQPKSDMPARFDFDGDWKGDNNWDNLDQGSSQAYVYYAVIESQSHWFLIYNVFHPRDYSDKCVAGTCHENDNEGLILTVRKDGSEFGKLEVMETLAHNNVYSFTNDRRIRNGLHNIDGGIDLYNNSHPVVFIESGGHGIQGGQGSHSGYDFKGDKFSKSTGITLIYKGTAERPRHAADRLVGYELLPIQEHWWTKAAEDSGWRESTFDEFLVYQPYGGRPSGSGKKIGNTFLGRKESSNKAKPFWGWHDVASSKKKILNAGQWALDPAYSVQKNLTFPSGEAPSVDYTFNPYLGIEQ